MVIIAICFLFILFHCQNPNPLRLLTSFRFLKHTKLPFLTAKEFHPTPYYAVQPLIPAFIWRHIVYWNDSKLKEFKKEKWIFNIFFKDNIKQALTTMRIASGIMNFYVNQDKGGDIIIRRGESTIEICNGFKRFQLVWKRECIQLTTNPRTCWAMGSISQEQSVIVKMGCASLSWHLDNL